MPDSPPKFDLELAKEHSSNNPVYYVQYGHARISSVLKNAEAADVSGAAGGHSLAAIVHPAELAVARRLAELPRLLHNVVDHYAPHRLTHCAREVTSVPLVLYWCKILKRMGLGAAIDVIRSETLVNRLRNNERVRAGKSGVFDKKPAGCR